MSPTTEAPWRPALSAEAHFTLSEADIQKLATNLLCLPYPDPIRFTIHIDPDLSGNLTITLLALDTQGDTLFSQKLR